MLSGARGQGFSGRTGAPEGLDWGLPGQSQSSTPHGSSWARLSPGSPVLPIPSCAAERVGSGIRGSPASCVMLACYLYLQASTFLSVKWGPWRHPSQGAVGTQDSLNTRPDCHLGHPGGDSLSGFFQSRRATSPVPGSFEGLERCSPSEMSRGGAQLDLQCPRDTAPWVHVPGGHQREKSRLNSIGEPGGGRGWGHGLSKPPYGTQEVGEQDPQSPTGLRSPQLTPAGR